MLNDEFIRSRLEKDFTRQQADTLIWLMKRSYDELVKVSDFNELKAIVKDLGMKTGELAEAQKRTEERLDSLTQRVEELAQAQKRTEQRVEELAEAQNKTEKRMDSLTQRVEELAQAQKKTEKQVQALAGELKRTRKEIGGLAITVGYTLENQAFKSLPALLLRDYQIKIRGRLKRRYVMDKEGNEIEVNIFGEGFKNGNAITIIGEGKSQLSRRGVDEFIKKKLKRFEGVFDKICPILVTHMTTSSDVENYTRKKGIILYFSYDL